MFRGVVEITALLLTKITLRKFVSVKSVNDNGDISTTPPTFFSKTEKSPENGIFSMSPPSLDFWGSVEKIDHSRDTLSKIIVIIDEFRTVVS